MPAKKILLIFLPTKPGVCYKLQELQHEAVFESFEQLV